MLMLAQIDDRSGEVLGAALEELMAMGARNVQLLSSHTKKGRPGNVLLVDADDTLEPEVAAYLAAELGVWGYHVLVSAHRHFDVVQEDRLVEVVCGTRRRTFTLPCKFFAQEGTLLRVKVESSDVEDIRRYVAEVDAACSSDSVRAILEHEVRCHPGEGELEVHLS